MRPSKRIMTPLFIWYLVHVQRNRSTEVNKCDNSTIILKEQDFKLFNMIHMFVLKSYIPDTNFLYNLIDIVLLPTEHWLSLNCICIQLPF